MQYLTYDKYQEIGGMVDETAFARLIVKASAIIDNETFSRVEKMQEIPPQVEHCVRDLIDYFGIYDLRKSNITSKSQSVGGVSESESYGSKDAESQSVDIDNIVFQYLRSVCDDNDTPLLYKGARV